MYNYFILFFIIQCYPSSFLFLENQYICFLGLRKEVFCAT